MKKLVLVILLFTSCKTTSRVEYNEDKCITLTWKKLRDSFDVYLDTSIIATKVPCRESNTIVLHNYHKGEYSFIFKNNGRITEKKIVVITSQK